jgi:hypothetical protein
MFSDKDVGNLRDLNLALDAVMKQGARLRSQIDRLRNSRINPTERQCADHAIIRFMERVEGVDIEAVKARLRAYTEQCSKTGVRGIMMHPDGNQVVTNRAGLIVTVLPPGTTSGYESKDWDEEGNSD